MRNALLATAVMNLAAGLAFLPPAQELRALVGMPDGEPVYLATVALFVMLPLQAVVTASGDLVFGAMFAWWLLTSRQRG
jgi:hypothetical protein